MTNYNERLSEVFQTLNNKAREKRASCTERNNWEGYNSAYEILEYEAKQAITSLIKELVTEANPTVVSKEVIETYLQNGMTQKAAEYHGRNHAINEFEQNLLRALEEV